MVRVRRPGVTSHHDWHTGIKAVTAGVKSPCGGARADRDLAASELVTVSADGAATVTTVAVTRDSDPGESYPADPSHASHWHGDHQSQ